MRSWLNISVIIALAIFAILLQTQSSFLQATHAHIALTQDEMTYLQSDIAADSVLLQEYLELQQSSDMVLISEKKELLDEECSSRKAHFDALIADGTITSKASETYVKARKVHGELESLKDTTISQQLNGLRHSYDQEGNIEKFQNYRKTFLVASEELESFSRELSDHSIAINEKSSRNSLLTIGASLAIGFLSFVKFFPRRTRRLFSEREMRAVEMIRRNSARGIATTIKDIKRECGITHPTAQTLIQGLQRKNLVLTQKSGREKRLFLQ